MKKAVRSRKYFAPQTDDKERRCDHPGCNKPGEYRAPKNRKLKEYYWFCLEHVQEYDFAAMDEVYYNEEERRFLQIMELKPSEVSIESLKKQYKKLVKKYHPDVNQDDKTAEEKFKQLTIAYKALLAKFS